MPKFLTKVMNAASAIISAPADILNTIADGLAFSGHQGSRFYSTKRADNQHEENQRRHYSREFQEPLPAERKDEALSMMVQREDTSLLFAAVEHGDFDEVKKMIDAGVDVNQMNPKGRTPLMWAAYYGHDKIVELLLEAKADPNIVATEFRSGARAIDLAIRPIHLSPKRRGEVNYEDRRQSEYDSKLSPQLKIVQSLLKAGSEEPENMPYHPAKIVQAVREARPEIDMRKSKRDLGYELLAEFEGRGGGVDVERCMKLVKAGADLGVHYQYHDTPLFYAAGRGHEQLVDAMIEAGAEVNLKNKFQATPLSCAAGGGHTAIVSKLIEAGARVDNSAYVHEAASHGHHEVISQLLRAGANINWKGGWGFERTPLMSAAYEGHIKAVEVLLEAGADINIRTRDGENAAAIAKKRSNDVIVELINQKSRDALNKEGKPSIAPWHSSRRLR